MNPSLQSPCDISENRYVVTRSAVIEDFDDASLVFLCEERRLIQINTVTRDILKRLNGRRTVKDIADALLSVYAVSFDEMLKDAASILSDLESRSIIKELNRMALIKDLKKMNDSQYTINHDVSCRIEEPEGAILFNPETDAVQAVNPTGLAIWRALEYPKTKQELVEHLLDVCEDVPMDRVVKDVEDFVDRLKTAGFIGEVLK